MANSGKHCPRASGPRGRPATNDARDDSPPEAGVTPICRPIDQKREVVLSHLLRNRTTFSVAEESRLLDRRRLPQGIWQRRPLPAGVRHARSVVEELEPRPVVRHLSLLQHSQQPRWLWHHLCLGQSRRRPLFGPGAVILVEAIAARLAQL